MKIITLTQGHDPKAVQRALQAVGQWTSPFAHGDQVQLLVEPHSAPISAAALEAIEGVAKVWAAKSGHPRMDAHPAVVDLGLGVRLGRGVEPILMGGPCSVESEEQIHEAARMVAATGARVLRGGCFKPRTSPYSFRGRGVEGLEWMRQAADAHKLLMVTEAMAPEQVEVVAEHADLFQIGARNMQNFDLLHAVGRMRKPVLLKRGLSATIHEWVMAAEHLMHAGSDAVILCERGIRSFDDTTRFLLDLSAVVQIEQTYELPVIVDPSHAAGRKDLIGPLGKAALACGAHGLIVETHPTPEVACSDGPQQLNPTEWAEAAASWGFAPKPVVLTSDERRERTA